MIARAMRGWALAEPACWALLYGSPVPGYHAPAEITTAPGTRVVGALFDARSPPAWRPATSCSPNTT